MTNLIIKKDTVTTLSKAIEGPALTSEYRTAETWKDKKGEVIKCFYLGCKTMTNDKEEEYEIALFHDGKQPFVAGQTILVEAVKNLPQGQGVSITCLGTKKRNSGSGVVVQFDVKILEFAVDTKK